MGLKILSFRDVELMARQRIARDNACPAWLNESTQSVTP
jgi:hypothetical protein